MTIGEAITAFIAADATLAAKVTKVYPSTSPQTPPDVYAVYQVVTNVSESSHDGATDITSVRLRVTFWDKSNKECEGLCNRLRVIVKNFNGKMGGVAGVTFKTFKTYGPRDTFNPETRFYGQQLDILALVDMSTVS